MPCRTREDMGNASVRLLAENAQRYEATVKPPVPAKGCSRRADAGENRQRAGEFDADDHR